MVAGRSLALLYALEHLPDHWSGEDDEFIDSFESRWGDTHDDTLMRVTREGRGKDRAFALLVLGYEATSEARDCLLPLLESPEPVDRQLSAIELGRMRERHALPVLFKMLVEFQPPAPDATDQAFGHPMLPRIPRILGTWGETSAVPPLRGILEKALLAELAVREPLREAHIAVKRPSQRDGWISFQDEIVYALGQLGAFGAVVGLTGVDAHLELWRVHLIMGHLHGRYAIPRLLTWSEIPELHEKVVQLLERQFGLNADERASSLKRYEVERGAKLGGLYHNELL